MASKEITMGAAVAASKVMVAVEEGWEDEVEVEGVVEAWVAALTGTTTATNEIAYQCVIDQSDF